MTFKDNPNYKEVHCTNDGKHIFYMPTDLANGYHISRKIAAEAQNIYSAAGITKEILEKLIDRIIAETDSEKKNEKVRSNVSLLANNIKYRMRYPIDEDCAIRMGSIYLFIEGENPDEVSNDFTQKKVSIAKQYPETYAFFLDMGLILTPNYKGLLPLSSQEDYFRNREVTIKTMKLI